MSRNLGIPVIKNGKYYFISYNSESADRIKPFVSELSDAGMPFWYDHGIEYGEEWEVTISKKIQNCEAVILFFTKDIYTKEKSYVKREFDLAKDYFKKKIYIVKLDQVKMEDVPSQFASWDVEINKLQNIQYSNFHNQEEFVLEILRAIGKKTYADHYKKICQDKDGRSEIEVGKKKRFAQKIQSLKRKMHVRRIGYVFAAMFFIVAIGYGGYQAYQHYITIEINENYSISTKDTYIHLNDVVVDKELIKKLNRIKLADVFLFSNCEFRETSPSELESISQARTLVLEKCTGINDFTWLGYLSKVITFEIKDMDITDNDLDPMRTCSEILFLAVSDCPNFTDLSVFEGSQYEELDICNTGVSELTPLASQRSLKVVKADDCPIKDVSPLAGLTTLDTLSFNRCQIENITEVFYSLNISSLEFDDNKLTEIPGFDNLTALYYVSFANNQIEQMDCIGKSKDTLYYMDLSYNPLSADLINQIRDCYNVDTLNLSGVSMYDLNVAKNMKGIQVLKLSDCKIHDVSLLENMTGIYEIDLSHNNIKNLPDLSGWRHDNLHLDLSYNKLFDLSNLPKENISVLNIMCNSYLVTSVNINTIADVEKNRMKNYIIADFDKDFLSGEFARLKPFSRYYLIDVPLDQRLLVEEIYGKNNVYYSEKEEIDEFIRLYGPNPFDWNIL